MASLQVVRVVFLSGWQPATSDLVSSSSRSNLKSDDSDPPGGAPGRPSKAGMDVGWSRFHLLSGLRFWGRHGRLARRPVWVSAAHANFHTKRTQTHTHTRTHIHREGARDLQVQGPAWHQRKDHCMGGTASCCRPRRHHGQRFKLEPLQRPPRGAHCESMRAVSCRGPSAKRQSSGSPYA